MPATHDAFEDDIEVLPVVVMTRAFQARPSSVPEIRDFVRHQLAGTALSSEHVRTLGTRVADVLLEAAGAGGMIKVSLRIFPDHAEVDLLRGNEQVVTPDRASVDVPRRAERGAGVRAPRTPRGRERPGRGRVRPGGDER